MELSELTGNVSDYIDWSLYAKTVVDICKIKGINYIVKEALAKYM
jgi:hypothetical protein